MSRERRPYHVFGFATTHEALKAEKVLKAAGVHVVPVPTPAVLGARCGIAMRVVPDDVESAHAVLAEQGVFPQDEADIEDV